jgi:hypothetical protein
MYCLHLEQCPVELLNVQEPISTLVSWVFNVLLSIGTLDQLSTKLVRLSALGLKCVHPVFYFQLMISKMYCFYVEQCLAWGVKCPSSCLAKREWPLKIGNPAPQNHQVRRSKPSPTHHEGCKSLSGKMDVWPGIFWNHRISETKSLPNVGIDEWIKDARKERNLKVNKKVWEAIALHIVKY